MRAFLLEQGFSNLDIEVDGNISPENAKLLRGFGANIFVAGTSSIFPRRGIVSEEKIHLMRNVLI